MMMLDHYTPKLVHTFGSKGGALGQVLQEKMGAILQVLLENVCNIVKS